MQTKLRLLTLFSAMALFSPLLAASNQSDSGAADVVNCRVLEAHASAHPAVVAIVFHQRDRADQARLGEFLENLAGESVEMQTSDGKWASVTVARLKSCFGRGLLLLSADSPAPKDGATFVLRFSSVGGKS